MSEATVVIEELPVILHEGRYRLYQNPDGGMRLVYKRNDIEELQHLILPAGMVRLAQAASEGKINPVDLMREMMKMRP